MTEVSPYWAAAVLDMADKGAVTQRQLAIALRNSSPSGDGYNYVRALRDAHRRGYLPDPVPFAVWRGRRMRVELTEDGRAALEDVRDQAELEAAMQAVIDAHNAEYHPGRDCVDEDDDGHCVDRVRRERSAES